MTIHTPSLTIPKHFDSTMRACFVACPQKYLLEFCYGLRPRGISIDLHAGACFAHAVETVGKLFYIEGFSLPDALSRAQVSFFHEWGDIEPPADRPHKSGKNRDNVWRAVESYFDMYPPAIDHVQPYFVEGHPTFEFTFAIPLDEETTGIGPWPLHPDGDPFIYCGRFDMLGEYGNRPCIRDEKTTGGSRSKNWADQWNVRAQFMGYVWAARKLGIDLDQVSIRGVFILKTKIDHEEAIKSYSDFMLARWLDQLRRDLWRLRQCYNSSHFDFNLGEACTSFGNCQFLHLCSMRDPKPFFEDFEVRFWNPLDANPTQDEAYSLASGGKA